MQINVGDKILSNGLIYETVTGFQGKNGYEATPKGDSYGVWCGSHLVETHLIKDIVKGEKNDN